MPQATLNLPLYSLPDEVGSLFAVLKNLVNSGQSSLREASRGLFVVDLLPAHTPRIDDITNCYKAHFRRYLLLTTPGYLISSIPSERETDMKVIAHPTVAGHWTILIGDRIYGCYDRRDLAIAVMLTR